MMRFGLCAAPEHLASLRGTGWDFVELPVTQALLPERAEGDVLPPLRAALADAALLPETWNLLLPGDLRVVGDGVDSARLRRYLDAACARAAGLGARVLVFGSGGPRRAPDGFPRREARRQMLEALAAAGDAAAPRGLRVALEPLNQAECNHVNTIAEALEYVQSTGHPALGVLADLYHMTRDGEALTEARLPGPLLAHTHVAGEGRRAPREADGLRLAAFFRVLKEMGYAGRVSVECAWDDLPAQAAGVRGVLRRAWDAA